MQRLKDAALFLFMLLLVLLGARFWLHKDNERHQKFSAQIHEHDRKQTEMAKAWEESCEKRLGVVISMRGNPRFCFAKGVILDTEKR